MRATSVCGLASRATRAAMELAEALFAPSFEAGQEQPNHREMYWYREGLKAAVPVLVGLNAEYFLSKLCDWLKISVEAKKHLSLEAGNDYSYVCAPAIEEHAQNSEHDFAGMLVGFVRQGFQEAIDSGKIPLDAALAMLERYSYLIFQRIRLHLLSEFAEQNAKLTSETILNHELFDNHRF